MAYTNIVTAPVDLEGVSILVGASACDVKSACTASNINKWSRYKPQNITKPFLLTLEERKSDHMGLTPSIITGLKEGAWIPSSGGTYKSVDEIKSNVKEWEYQRPTDDNPLKYRLGDFLDGDNINSQGYCHNAYPCDDPDWSDMNNRSDYLYSQSRCTVNYSGGKYSIGISNRFSGLNAVLTESVCIGSPANVTYRCPMFWIVGDGASSDYRFGLAVFVPNVNGTSGVNRWMFCVSDWSVKDITSTSYGAYGLPDLTTNQWLEKCLYDDVESSKATKSYDAVPCIIKGFGYSTYTDSSSSSDKTYSFVDVSSSVIYSVPSGNKGFKLKVVYSNEMPTLTINGKNYTAKARVTTTNWYIFQVPNGRTGAGERPINNIVLLYCTMTNTGTWVNSSNTNPKIFGGSITYSYYDTSSSSTTTTTKSGLSAPANSTVSLSFSDGATVTMNGLLAVTNGLAVTYISNTLT